MRLSSFQRAGRYGRQYRGSLVPIYALGMLTVFWSALIVADLGLVTDLIDAGGRIAVPAGEFEAVRRWAGPPSYESAHEGIYENAGLLPWTYGVSAKPGGSIATGLFQGVPALRSNLSALGALLLAGFVAAAAHSVSRYLLKQSTKSAAERVATGMRRDLHQQIFRLGASSFSPAGRVRPAELFDAKTVAVRRGLEAQWTCRAYAYPAVAVLAALALVVEAAVALATMLVAALVYYVLQGVSRNWRHRRALLGDRAEQQMSQMLATVSQVRLVQGYRLDDTPGEPFEESLRHYHLASLARSMNEARFVPVVQLLVSVGGLFVLGLLGASALRRPSATTISDGVVIVAAVVGIFPQVRRIFRRRARLLKADRAAKLIFEYLDLQPPVGQLPDAKPLEPLAEGIELRDVTLRKPSGRTLLDAISLRIPARTLTAILTSDHDLPTALACLLARFDDPQQGAVLFDGRDVRHATVNSLRSQVALVLADAPLFTGSVRENIGCGDDRFTALNITEAAKAAHAYAFVQRLPQGFDTIVGDHGTSLAPSEVYRVALARALLRDPCVLVLQEPTDELDKETSALLDDALRRTAKRRTVIALPSRLSTLRAAARVFLIHDGRLEGEGTHADLLRDSELYRHLQYIRFNEFRNVTPA